MHGPHSIAVLKMTATKRKNGERERRKVSAREVD